MELLCPNCQQRVTVPDQFAGQVMKCPHCTNTFTTPSLAPATASSFVPPAAPPTPVTAEPLPAVSSAPAAAEAVPAVQATPSEPVTGDYRHRLAISLSPRVLPWIAVAALVIVFILTFFSWAGYYPGGISVATQNAWQAAFGSYSYDHDLAKVPPLSNAEGKDQIQAGANGLLIVFIFIFLIALLAAIFAAAVRVMPVVLPAAVERLRPWFWAIVAAVTALAFLFLVLQLLSGFSLSNRIRERVESIGANVAQTDNPTSKKEAEIETALRAGAARYACALWTSFWLMLLALICAALSYFLSRRISRPVPRLELMW
jgi:hypothetical protein